MKILASFKLIFFALLITASAQAAKEKYPSGYKGNQDAKESNDSFQNDRFGGPDDTRATYEREWAEAYSSTDTYCDALFLE